MHISSAPSCVFDSASLRVSLAPLVPVEYKLWYDQVGFHIARWLDDGTLDELWDLGVTVFRNRISETGKHPADQFQALFDEEYVRFVSSFKKYQSTVLILTFGRPAVYEFARDNRVLFWLCCHQFAVGAINKEQSAYLITMRKRDILHALYGKFEKRYAKAISKLTLKTWNSIELGSVVKLLQNSVFVDAFRHWKRIPVRAVQILERYPFLRNSRILHRFSCHADTLDSEEFPSDLKIVYFDTVELGKRLGLKHGQSIVDACETVPALRLLHDSWSITLNKRLEPLEIDELLPKSPISGRRWVSHLRSVNAVLREASEMQHCLATYVEKLKAGQSFVYKVTEPERATCELVRRKDLLEVQQIALFRNGVVSEETQRRVAEWLATENKQFRRQRNQESHADS